MNQIQLIALDMDGTLLNTQNEISPDDQQTIRRAVNAGVEVIISTGRPYSGLPIDLLVGLGIRYVITMGGAAIYRIPEKECILKESIPQDLMIHIVENLQDKEILLDVFMDGFGYTQTSKRYLIEKMGCSDSNKIYLKNSRTPVDDLLSLVTEPSSSTQKGTINFYPLPDGSYKDYDETKAFLLGTPGIAPVTGGFHNLEFTKAGVSKATALKHLVQILQIPIETTMACGDTENDISIIQAAGIGVAMQNADEEVKEAADYITLSNNESGVAHAIKHFVLKT